MADLNPNPRAHPLCEHCAAFAPPRFHVPEKVMARVQNDDGTVAEPRMIDTTAYGDRRGVCRRHPVAVQKDLSDWCMDHIPMKESPR